MKRLHLYRVLWATSLAVGLAYGLAMPGTAWAGTFSDPMTNWQLDEGSGSTAGDSGPDGFAGTVHGGTWSRGVLGTGLSLNGISDYIDITNGSGYPAAIGSMSTARSRYGLSSTRYRRATRFGRSSTWATESEGARTQA